MRSSPSRFPLSFLLLSLLLPWHTRAVDFGTEILPIFQNHCFECHGEKKQKSDLRLDLRSAAMRGGSEGPSIVPGKPESSRLLEYVKLSDNDDLRMPPEGPALSSKQVATLEKWITGGAEWPDHLAGEDVRLDHWAWQPLRTTGKEKDIDSFIRAKLQEKKLPMSPPSDRTTLIRRLTFDLHGLPPTPAEVQAFVEDDSAGAYTRLVERLLASPRYGERYARHWLDIAHYADTHGFERDKRRDNAWRYRDYVIDSFNMDKAYDRFLSEQIAGDVLFPDNPDATIATGFLAAGPWDYVGHVETKSPLLKRSARALDLDDMATQVMTATVAMTVNCARCHDHKLDPISQKEYFQISAVFAGVNRAERVISDRAQVDYEKAKRSLTEQRNELARQIGKLEGIGLNLADVVGGGDGRGTGKAGDGIDPRSGKVQARSFGELDKVKTNQFAPSELDFVDGVFLADGEKGAANIPVSSTGLTITGIPETNGKAWDHIRNGAVAKQHSTELEGIDFAAEGHSLLGIHANAGITFDLEAIRKAGGESFNRLTASVGYFGAAGAGRADVWVFVDGKSAGQFRQLGREDGLQDLDIPLPAGTRFLTLLTTDGENGYSHDQVGFGDTRLFVSPPPGRSDEEIRKLTRLKKKSAELEKKLAALAAPGKFYGVTAAGEMPEVRMQRRGNPEAEFGDPLAPGAFSALKMLEPSLGDTSSSEAERRAALAKWITHADNPLTPRVIVNRLWHWHFGRGIVDTPSDFGLGGPPPSHPGLLDWLACELVENDWSLKHIHRLILHSDTYRQQSRYADDAPGLNIDATNQLLWRQNPRRVEAEAVRDAVLAVSGKLNPQRGGPGFEDFRFTEAYAPVYEYITADEPKLWRRSIYRYIVRTTPNRFLTTLDCPDPANLTPKRLSTTTPLQSLALYNNEFMIKQAGYFAERLCHEAGTDILKQVDLAFRYAFGRSPTVREAELSTEFVERESLFALCRSLLNANEFVYID